MTTNQTIDGVPCAHDWTDDGEYLIVCTKCGEQENHDPAWRDMATAPTDGTMVRLLVEFEEHSTEDAEQAPTIGANNFDNDGEDVWRFAGWCWSHDHFTEGKGTPVGWLPMLGDPIVTPAAQPQGEPVAYDQAKENKLFEDWARTQCDVSLRLCDIGLYYQRDTGLAHDAWQHRAKLAEQPAPVVVVMPERMALEKPESHKAPVEIHNGVVTGWNACLDEVTRLNTK